MKVHLTDIANKLVKISNKSSGKFDISKPEGDKDRTGNIERKKYLAGCLKHQLMMD